MLVSVLIPSFNRGSMVQRAVDSALAQDYTDKEIIVVDDCSSDDTKEVLASYGDAIRYIRHETNRGVGAARNTGIEHAKGELLAFLDSDDRWRPVKLSKQVAMFKQYPDSGIIGAGCILMDVNGEQIGSPNIPQKHIPLEKISISVSLPGAGSNVMIPANVIADIGGFAEDMVRAQDYHLFLRIAMKYPVRAVPEVLAEVGVHDTPRPGVNLQKTIDCRKRIQNVIEDKTLRRKNISWMYYVIGKRLFFKGHMPTGASFLAKSFLNYPMKISPDHARLRPFLGVIKDRLTRS